MLLLLDFGEEGEKEAKRPGKKEKLQQGRAGWGHPADRAGRVGQRMNFLVRGPRPRLPMLSWVMSPVTRE